MRLLLALLIFASCASPGLAQRFAAVSFHDVIDDQNRLGPDDITTAQLTAFFDWLKGNGWSSISLDDIEAARAGIRPLPERAILLTFDDGYASAYGRAYPLLQAYRFHAVFFLVGAWMDAPLNAKVRYGDQVVPRSAFLSWDQAREMQASGFAEFGSHSYDLHRVIVGNPQGGAMPATATWAYDPQTARYETDAELTARVLVDLRRSVTLMQRNLGRAPRALAWPYGRYSGPALAAARQVGVHYFLTLTSAPAELMGDTSQSLEIPRGYPSQNPSLQNIISLLRFSNPDPDQRRVVCVDLDRVAGANAAQSEQQLGRTIEDLRHAGANTVVIDAMGAPTSNGAIPYAWFPSALLPVKSDFLGFAAWQIRSRAGADVYLRIDLRAAEAAVGSARLPDLVREIVRVAPIDGILLDPPGVFLSGGSTPTAPYPWSVRAQRDALLAAEDHDQPALDAWRVAEAERPGLRLAIAAPSQLPGEWPAPAADLILLSSARDGVAAQAADLASRGWLAANVSGRLVLPLPDNEHDRLVRDLREAQSLGASGFAICPAPHLPLTAGVSAAFSSARFPKLP